MGHQPLDCRALDGPSLPFTNHRVLRSTGQFNFWVHFVAREDTLLLIWGPDWVPPAEDTNPHSTSCAGFVHKGGPDTFCQQKFKVLCLLRGVPNR